MIAILGSTGYIATSFIAELTLRKQAFTAFSRSYLYRSTERFYTERHWWLNFFKPMRKDYSLVINCAAFVPQPSVDFCKIHVTEAHKTNTAFPTMLSGVCRDLDIPLAHISTACLWDDRRFYAETDEPTRDWNGYCGVYLQSKYAAEREVNRWHKSYIWRIRLPFDHLPGPRNYLSKLRSFKAVWNQTNSLTHRGDFVKAALDMVERRVPYGTYNMVNEGAISSRNLLTLMGVEGNVVPSPIAGGLVSCQKLADAGIHMRNVHEAVNDSIRNWKGHPSVF